MEDLDMIKKTSNVNSIRWLGIGREYEGNTIHLAKTPKLID